MKKELYEKLGLFYLGKQLDYNQEPNGLLELVKNKNFTTHAAIIGMTGSGKTGLGISILEEAALDNIPALIIDPKGDMGNLLLAFDDFDPKKFEPWIDPMEAEKKGLTPSQYAKEIAKMWKEGIESFHQDEERVKRYKNSADFTIYTPGSSAGVPVSLLSSFSVPDREIMEDIDSYAYLLSSTAASLLSLVGIDSEGSDFVLVSNIIDHYWQQNISPTLEDIVASIINPPIKKIGILPLESFYPQNERMKLALKFNNILSSPSFKNWLKGEPLNISKMLFTQDGKPRHSIFYIAHLSENERNFFVTKLLNELISWMRRQSGTSALRALLYMDEIFGFFPPNANPPSKKPMMLLLKQARAYGVGVVLSTQNPVDLDYKGLSNIGMWFLGRLQTKQDIERVADGLMKSGSAALDKSELKKLLTNLKKRVFLLRSIHKESLELFQTRWVMSYLKGPLSKEEIKRLMKDKKGQIKKEKEISLDTDLSGSKRKRAVISGNIRQLYDISDIGADEFTFFPSLFLKSRLHYYSSRYQVDKSEEIVCEIPLKKDMKEPDFSFCQESEEKKFKTTPPSNSYFLEPPAFLSGARSLKGIEREFKDYLYQNRRLTLYRVKKLRLQSYPDESLEEFKTRVLEVLQDRKDEEIEKLQQSYAKKMQRLQDKLERLYYRLQEEKEQAKSRTTDTIISIGMALLDSFFGRKRVKKSTIAKAGGAISKAKKAYGEYNDIKYIQEQIERVKHELLKLEQELEEKSDKIYEKYTLANYPIEPIYIKPRKSDIKTEAALLWRQV